MCGLAVRLRSDGSGVAAIVRRLTRAPYHCGPDAQAAKLLPGCGLGNTWLSCIDVEGGRQPMTDETMRCWIVRNGDRYNYRDLRDQLRQKGCHFRTRSVT